MLHQDDTKRTTRKRPHVSIQVTLNSDWCKGVRDIMFFQSNPAHFKAARKTHKYRNLACQTAKTVLILAGRCVICKPAILIIRSRLRKYAFQAFNYEDLLFSNIWTVGQKTFDGSGINWKHTVVEEVLHKLIYMYIYSSYKQHFIAVVGCCGAKFNCFMYQQLFCHFYSSYVVYVYMFYMLCCTCMNGNLQ